MTKEVLESSLNTLDIWLIAFGILVAIGVVGESVAGYMHWRRSGQLQKIQTVENLSLKKSIAEANERAEQLKSANVKLSLAMMPRRIAMQGFNGDDKKRAALFDKTSEYAGTIALIQSVDDVEARQLSWDIKAALDKSGWKASITDEAHSRIPSGYIWEGVQVVTLEESPFIETAPGGIKNPPPPFSAASHAAKALVQLLSLDLGPPRGPLFFGVHWDREFAEPNMAHITQYGFRFPDGAVVILVGLRPLTYSLPPAPPVHLTPDIIKQK